MSIVPLEVADNGAVSLGKINDNFAELEETFERRKVIYKSADETVNNSSTLQNDDHLSFAIGANEAWSFTLFLKIESGGIPDFKYYFTKPSGTFQMFPSYAFSGHGDGTTTESAAIVQTLFGDINIETATGVVEAGGTGGTFQLQWAQNKAHESDTKLLQGSYIIAERLA
jgi:hypothetical protein